MSKEKKFRGVKQQIFLKNVIIIDVISNCIYQLERSNQNFFFNGDTDGHKSTENDGICCVFIAARVSVGKILLFLCRSKDRE